MNGGEETRHPTNMQYLNEGLKGILPLSIIG